jgi:hypothetical protein
MPDINYEEKYLQALEQIDELKALMREVVIDDWFCQNEPSFEKQWNDALEEPPEATEDKPIWLMTTKKPIWLVWTAEIGGDRILYHLRSVCSIKERAEMYKQTCENEPLPRGIERRVVHIEESLTNHLYGEWDMRLAGYGPRGNVP